MPGAVLGAYDMVKCAKTLTAIYYPAALIYDAPSVFFELNRRFESASFSSPHPRISSAFHNLRRCPRTEPLIEGRVGRPREGEGRKRVNRSKVRTQS